MIDPLIVQQLIKYGTPEEQKQLLDIIEKKSPVWVPMPGPQTMAYESEADIVWLGGGAGSGKSSAIVGLCLTKFHRSIIFRKQATQLPGIIEEIEKIVGNRDGFNGSNNIWRLPKRIAANCQIEFGSTPNPGDFQKYQGRAHECKAYDEITAFTEEEFRYMNGWLRTSDKGVKCQVFCTGNPPTTPEGEWVIKFWAPWLDPDHPNPAKSGELRWFAMLDGKEYERPHGKPFEYQGNRVYPKSRTFIFSTVKDNMFYMATGYDQTLEALPEPLRSQMLLGKFNVGKVDDQWQLFPTAWIERAQARWTEDGRKGKAMSAMGVDVARGGIDETVLSRRHENWFDKILTFPGSATPDGASVAGLVMMNMRDGAVIHIDIIGVGGSAYDHLNNNLIQIVGVDARHKGRGTDKSGMLRFGNKRAEICWRFRELLDPENGHDIALPPGGGLKAELCAFRWEVRGNKDGSIIQVRSKDEIKELLGRSPNEAEAVIYASIPTEKKRADKLNEFTDKIANKLNGGRRSAMSS